MEALLRGARAAHRFVAFTIAIVSSELVRLFATPKGAFMLFAAVHHIHDLAGFQRVLEGVPVYPQTGAKKHWKASSLWEASEGLTVIDTGKLIDRVCGRYAENECCLNIVAFAFASSSVDLALTESR
jgi:hypothetical protein